MSAVFALLAALGYGTSDFIGGLGSRKSRGFTIAVVNQIASVTLTSLAALVLGAGSSAPALAWGALAGVGAGMGVAFLYRGLAAGRMGVIAPVSAIGSALLPVIVGVALGERPGALVWAGVVLAIPGVWLVASGTDDQAPSEPVTRGLLDGILAGVGFGLFFVSIGQVPAGSGVAPLAVAQGSALLCLVALALVTRSAWVPRDRTALWGVAAGAIGAVSAGAFLLATQSGLLTVVAVLSALYPAVTVVLAVVVLRERVLRPQAVGLALCIATVVLVAAG